ncbi:MAG: GxxExxY protein [Prevotellaceae bacterium]|jgi:GxxExxY protein|nr:GxxExxY protein [Prevotellaceae bacterium]
MFLYKEETYKIIGAAMEVHKQLGCGFLEAVYEEALTMEFQMRAIPFEQQKVLHIYYKGVQLQKHYIADLCCCDKIIVELKALSELTSINEAQLLNYLKITNLKVGLLINFGRESLEYKRFVL